MYRFLLSSGEIYNIGVSHIMEPPHQGSDFFSFMYSVDSVTRYIDRQPRGLQPLPFSQGSDLPFVEHVIIVCLSASIRFARVSHKIDTLPSPGKCFFFLQVFHYILLSVEPAYRSGVPLAPTQALVDWWMMAQRYREILIGLRLRGFVRDKLHHPLL